MPFGALALPKEAIRRLLPTLDTGAVNEATSIWSSRRGQEISGYSLGRLAIPRPLPWFSITEAGILFQSNLPRLFALHLGSSFGLPLHTKLGGGQGGWESAAPGVSHSARDQ